MGARRMLWIAGLAAIFAFPAAQLEVNHGITHFIPSGRDALLLELSTRMSDSPRARTAILSLSLEGAPAGHEALLAEAASLLADALDGRPGVARVIRGGAFEAWETLQALYFPRRVYRVSADPERDVPALTRDASLRARARALRVRLAGPRGAMASRNAPADPLDLFARDLERARSQAPELEVRDGSFLTRDGRHAIVFVEASHSPLDSDRERPFQEEIAQAFHGVAAQVEPLLVLEQAGIGRIALATEAQVRGDLRRIGTLSVLGVSTLFLLVFPPRGMILALLPALAGFAAACGLGQWLWGRVHGATLAFGASLIGIAVDYSIHLLNHHGLLPAPGGAPASARRLRPSLLLGVGTTLAGFAGFGFTEFPGVREMGLFTMFGIAVAWVVTLLALPTFLRDEEPARPIQRRLAGALGRAFVALRAMRGLQGGLLVATAALAAGTAQLTWQDDPQGLTLQDATLLREDAAVRARVSRIESGRVIVAMAPDAQSALERNDAVWRRLQGAIAEGALGGAQSLHDLVPSLALQRRNLAALRAEPELATRIDEAFRAEGFAAGAFAPFARAIAEPSAPPLRPKDLDGTPLAATRDALWFELGDQQAALTYLRDVRDPAAVAQAVAGLPGVYDYDARALRASLYGDYRRKTGQLLAVGAVLVLGLLALRYRSWRPTLAAFAPSMLAMGAALGVFGWLGMPMNLIGLASLLLVLGILVDYGIFLVDSGDDPEHRAVTLLSVAISCATTLFVFGALALSVQPVLRGIGLVTGVGVLVGALLTPTAFLLLGKAEPAPRANRSGS